MRSTKKLLSLLCEGMIMLLDAVPAYAKSLDGSINFKI